jgi:hypothetical protein
LGPPAAVAGLVAVEKVQVIVVPWPGVERSWKVAPTTLVR